jgi:hypothetical protein
MTRPASLPDEECLSKDYDATKHDATKHTVAP